MAKIGVGVGDEFPVDEGKPREESEGGPRHEGCHDDWREHRREWKRRWREQHRAWHGHSSSGHWQYHAARHWLPALFIIGGIALLIAIISHFFYFILGAAVLAALYISHGRNHGDWNNHPRRRSAEQN